jgi:hypothetical protein
LIAFIDNLQQCEKTEPLRDCSGLVQPDGAQQVISGKEISPVPRDLTEDHRLNRVLESAENLIEDSQRIRNTWQENRVNSVPQTKTQLKKARKIKRLQEAGKKQEAEPNQRLWEI